MDFQTKKYELKDLSLGDSGTFRAIFATLNVIDHDGDLTLPGAFGKQDVIVSQYNHGSWGNGVDALPIGVGKIFEDGEDAIVEGEFNLENEAAKATYQTIKYLHEKQRTQEWSYALPEIEWEMRQIDGRDIRVLKKIKVPEVSPVLMGAGIGTRLLSIKNKDEKRAFGRHSTATNDRAWSASSNVANVRRDEKRNYYGRVYGWYDPDGEVGNKSTYKFPHHFVNEAGAPGAASTRACQNGIAVLNGARGGANIPSDDRQGVWNHLAGHLRDADLEPAELRSLDAEPRSFKLQDHFSFVISEASDLLSRLTDLKTTKAVRGKDLTEATVNSIGLLTDTFAELTAGFIGLVSEKQTNSELERESLRYEIQKSRSRTL